MHISVKVVIFVAATVFATDATNTESNEVKSMLMEEKLPAVEVNDLSSIENSSEDENKRIKKSATTTFCVEIRPSGAHQRPFQVCEPVEQKPQDHPYSAATAAPQQPYYSASSYGQQPKAPAAAGTYAAPAAAASSSYKQRTFKPAAGFSPASTKSFAALAPAHERRDTLSLRNNEEDFDENDNQHLNFMRATDGSEDDESIEDHSGEASDNMMRSVAYGGSSYGSSNYGSPHYSGSPVSYVPVHPAHQKKHHSGLVITCQPNLAGYAHGAIPSHGGGYKYRSSSGYGRPLQFGNYPQTQSYGSSTKYNQHSSGYKAPVSQYKPAGYGVSSGYAQASAPGPIYSRPQPDPSRPAFGPQTNYAAPQYAQGYRQPQQYAAPASATQYMGQAVPLPQYSQAQASAPVTQYAAAPPLSQGSAPVIQYGPAASPSASQASTSSYSAPQSAGYAAPSSTVHKYSTSTYTPPPTYRKADENTETSNEIQQTQQTMKNIQQHNINRAKTSQWHQEMRESSKEADEHIKDVSTQNKHVDTKQEMKESENEREAAKEMDMKESANEVE